MKKNYLFLFFVLLLGLSLRVDRLGERSLWYDEINTVNSAVNITTRDIIDLSMKSLEPPLYRIMLHYMSFLGNSEFVLRFTSLFLGIFSILVLFLLSKTIWDKETALFSSLLLAISTFHIAYSQEVRSYSLLVFLSICSVYFLWHALFYGRRFYWLWWVCVVILNIFTHYIAFHVFLVEYLFILILVLIKRKIKTFLIINGILIMIFIGYWIIWGDTVQWILENSVKYFGKVQNFSMDLRFFTKLLAKFSNGYNTPIIYIYLVLFLLGFFSSFKDYRLVILFSLWFSIPFIALIFIKTKDFFDYRYIIYILPMYLLCVGRGINLLRYTVSRLIKRDMGMYSISILFVLLNTQPLIVHHRTDKDNWKKLCEYLNCNGKGIDSIYVAPFMNRVCMEYYLNKTFNVYSWDRNGAVNPEHIKRKLTKRDRIWYTSYNRDNDIFCWHNDSISDKLSWNDWVIEDRIEFDLYIVLYRLCRLEKFKGITSIKFEGEYLASRVGAKVYDKDAINKSARMADRRKDKEGWLTFGPYIRLPSGRYQARFRLKIEDNTSKDDVAFIDIYARKEDPKRPSLYIKGVDFSQPMEYQDFILEFEQKEDALEFRVRFTGKNTLWVDCIEVKGIEISS